MSFKSSYSLISRRCFHKSKHHRVDCFLSNSISSDFHVIIVCLQENKNVTVKWFTFNFEKHFYFHFVSCLIRLVKTDIKLMTCSCLQPARTKLQSSQKVCGINKANLHFYERKSSITQERLSLREAKNCLLL